MAQAKWTEIDGLRALAVGAVMVAHWGSGWVQHLGPGSVGVRLFFVISGFLITGILLRGRDRLADGGGLWDELKTFYARRTLRIFPVYYAILAVGTALALLGAIKVPGLAWHWGYLSNHFTFNEAAWVAPTVHFWSLAVEEQFYLIWPAVVLLTPSEWLKRVVVLMILASPILRMSLYVLGFDPSTQIGVLLPANLDTLGLGAMLALMRENGGRAPSRVLAWAAVVGLGGHLACSAVRMTAGVTVLTALDPTLIGLASFAVIGFIVQNRGARAIGWLNWAPLQYLGQISYGLYLYHYFVGLAVDRLGLSTLPMMAVSFVGTVIVASASWFFFEKPILGLKDRFSYGQRRGAYSPAATRA